MLPVAVSGLQKIINSGSTHQAHNHFFIVNTVIVSEPARTGGTPKIANRAVTVV